MKLVIEERSQVASSSNNPTWVHLALLDLRPAGDRIASDLKEATESARQATERNAREQRQAKHSKLLAEATARAEASGI